MDKEVLRTEAQFNMRLCTLFIEDLSFWRSLSLIWSLIFRRGSSWRKIWGLRNKWEDFETGIPCDTLLKRVNERGCGFFNFECYGSSWRKRSSNLSRSAKERRGYEELALLSSRFRPRLDLDDLIVDRQFFQIVGSSSSSDLGFFRLSHATISLFSRLRTCPPSLVVLYIHISLAFCAFAQCNSYERGVRSWFMHKSRGIIGNRVWGRRRAMRHYAVWAIGGIQTLFSRGLRKGGLALSLRRIWSWVRERVQSIEQRSLLAREGRISLNKARIKGRERLRWIDRPIKIKRKTSERGNCLYRKALYS